MPETARPGLDPKEHAPLLLIVAEGDSVVPVGVPVPARLRTEAKTGSRVGFAVGGAAGAATFVFFGVLVESLCEYDCPDIKPLGWVGLGLSGFGVGAVTGALLGSLFGSMIPARGAETATSPTVLPGHGPAARDRYIASLTVQPGFGTLTERPGAESAFTFRATLLAQLRPWVAVGPEYTFAALAGNVNALAGTIILGERGKRLSPYVVGDLGAYFWSTGRMDNDISVLGAGLGAGILWSPGSGRIQLGLEGRYHWTPQNIEDPEFYRFVNLGAMARLNW